MTLLGDINQIGGNFVKVLFIKHLNAPPVKEFLLQDDKSYSFLCLHWIFIILDILNLLNPKQEFLI